jgi:hypothetical protein
MNFLFNIRAISILAIAAYAGTLALNGTALAGIVSVKTENVGIYTDLLNVTVSGVGTEGPDSGLIGVSVFGYAPTHASGKNAGTSPTALSPDKTIGDFSEANLPSLLADSHLNTGLLNPGGTGGLSAGAQPVESTSNGTNGLGVTFDTPIENVAGAGVVVFDFAQAAGISSADPFVVNALSGGAGFSSHVVGIPVTIGSANYQASGKLQQTQAYTEMNPVGSLPEAESKTLAPGVVFGANPSLPAGYYAIEIPLSSFGLGPDVTQITGLWFQSTSLHAVFIAGLSVPEPSTVSLLALGSIGLWLLKFHRPNRTAPRVHPIVGEVTTNCSMRDAICCTCESGSNPS